ncbi:hypothetical protein LQV63_14250 [Paenibacillus profundus]|uniref:Uncharacterized protein n=1 Tax=Paenibacillus profundus TaxID=1173085 RepID=A0ABS8YEP2_9BACL|nr:hypothetical protein [Paenibacillus profundus]MCE5170473.1 hypothetical protein [Paenibacillus profundus]
MNNCNLWLGFDVIEVWFISYTATPPQRSSGNGNPILLLVIPLALTVAAYVLSIGIYVYRWLRDHDLRWRWGTIAAGGLLVVSMGVPAAALSRHVRSEVMKHQSYDPGLSPLTMHNNGVLCNGYTFMLLIGIAVLLAGVISLFTVRKSAFE